MRPNLSWCAAAGYYGTAATGRDAADGPSGKLMEKPPPPPIKTQNRQELQIFHHTFETNDVAYILLH